MTHAQEVEMRVEKHKAFVALQSIDLDKYKTQLGADQRLRTYIKSLLADEEGHNRYEILAAVRFFALCDKYEFKRKPVRRFIKFYEGLKFSGAKGRQCYKLTPIQTFQFTSIFGFYKWETEDGKLVLRRLIRRAILFVPRKFSKTTSTASIAVSELLTGDTNAQAYTAANSYKQAQVCFKEISALVKQLDPKKRYFKRSREHIEWKPNKFRRESFVECLSGGADTKDGLNASLIIFDEYAAAKYAKDHSEGAELLQVLESSSGVRSEYLTIIITTASRVPDGPFVQELEIAKAVLDGTIQDDRLFASLFLPDAWETEEPKYLGDPRVWKKCNPHIGVTVHEQFYADKYAGALHDPEKMLEFKTKLLNIFVSAGSKVWITASEIRNLENPDLKMETLTGRPPCMVGIDLSISDDLSAISYMIYGRNSRKFYSWTHFWIPEGILETHPNAELYRIWIEQGWLKTCKGKVIDPKDIVNDILAANEYVTILQVGYDSYKSQEVVNDLGAAIVTMGGRPADILRAVPQTFGAFTSPVETMEMAVRRLPAGIEFAENPIIAWMFGNAYLEEDRMENKKPLKRKENAKIDGVITNLECLWLFNNYEF